MFTTIIIGTFLLILINTGESIVCPSKYNSILQGCYKIYNGSNMTWSAAQQYCMNDSISMNSTGYTTHLVAFESLFETTSLVYWMKAWGIQSQFWIDGMASSSTWDWSGQPITWYFNSTDVIIYGNESNYQLVYDTTQSTYAVIDVNPNRSSNFICEYQERCYSNNTCQNNATCYFNVGRQLCICLPGYTGSLCDQQIDECLSSPCQHGGICTDAVDNYTCDCSKIFFTGANCEIPTADPTQGQRSAAFWSVFGVICGLVALLTLSDLPWDDIAAMIGCPWFRLKCCAHLNDDDEEDMDINQDHRPSQTSTNGHSLVTKQIIMPGTSERGRNYHVMNTVWNPEHLQAETPVNGQYSSYDSADPRTTPSDVLIQSFAAVVMAKHNEQKLEEKRVYAVDIVEQEDSVPKSKNAADTMVSWTQQLQEQLKSKQNRPASGSSTKELLHSEVPNEN